MQTRTTTLLILLLSLTCPVLAAERPFVTATMNTAQLSPGDPFIINGTTSGDTATVFIWVFGPSFRIMGVTLPVTATHQFSFTMPGEMTRTLLPGQYYAIVQDPGTNGVPDVTVGDNSTITLRSNTSYSLAVATLSPDEVTEELKALFSQAGIDDVYTKLTFTVAGGGGSAGVPPATPPSAGPRDLEGGPPASLQLEW